MSRAITCQPIVSHLIDGPVTVKIYTTGTNGFNEELITQRDPFAQANCRLIKCEKKIKVGSMQMRIGENIKTVYVKQHQAISAGHRLASLFLPSAAMRSFAGAVKLLQEGYATAEPVAAVEYRNWGVLIKSLYFAEEVTGAKTLDIFWQEHLAVLKGLERYHKKRAFLRALASLFRSLHAKRLYHNDLKAANLLFSASAAPPDGVFNVIDLQGLRHCFYVSKRRRIKNLAQLNRSLGQVLSNTEKLFFLKAYGGFSRSANAKQKHLIKNIVSETFRQIARERERLSNCAPVDTPLRQIMANEEGGGVDGNERAKDQACYA